MESVPIQNQAAAQKLLQKLNHPNQGDRHPRGRKYRGKGIEEDPNVLTLEEYEKRKAQAKYSKVPNISNDEDLAWQLHNQLNLEDSQVCKEIFLGIFVNCATFTFLPFQVNVVYICSGTNRSS